MLLLHRLVPLHFIWAGVVIACVTLALLWTTNKSLGISTSFENLCSLLSRRPYFRRPEAQKAGRWRLPFLAGLVGGGIVSALLAGGWRPLWDLGLLDQHLHLSNSAKMAWMFGGGLFIGFGTRLAGGCTSGHGIFGLANFEKASLRATLSFMAAGVATTQILYRLILA